jgi:hypothetical protein
LCFLGRARAIAWRAFIEGKRGATWSSIPSADAARKSASDTATGRTVPQSMRFKQCAITRVTAFAASDVQSRRRYRRVQDILTAIAYPRQTGESDIALVGISKAAMSDVCWLCRHPVQLQAPLARSKETIGISLTTSLCLVFPRRRPPGAHAN